jgi:steroid 5-alpha reductase family enzyme
MEIDVIVLWLGLGLSVAMMAAWTVQWRIKNAGFVDVIWTLALGAAGVASGLTSNGPRSLLVAGMTTIWALRLGGHILWRTWGTAEDARYAGFRANWGNGFQQRMFGFLQIQALAATTLTLSFVVTARNPAPLGATDIVGLMLFAVGIIGGGLADAQLARFRRDPPYSGALCDTGLWRYSRHPNYFFEIVAWCSWPMLGITPSYAWGWLALSGPALMFWLLVFVSGIPPLEEAMLRSRGEAYRAYQARTRALLPLPKRSRT